MEQKFQDWECVVHNDDPNDGFPKKIIESLNDPRFIFNQHRKNHGPVATLNHMFDYSDADYLCLLEDDNWWEDDFLSTMVAEMDNYPQFKVGYSDANLWQELPDNNWQKLSKTIYQSNNSGIIKEIYFPNYKSIYRYNHSNCSLIIRNYKGIEELKVPENIRIDFIEAIRERAFFHPILYVDKVLANFALTLQTTRKQTMDGVYEHYLLLIDSFFNTVNINNGFVIELWKGERKSNVRSFYRLLYAGIMCKNSRKLLRGATLSEWLLFFAYNLKHPLFLYHCLNAKKKYIDLWKYLTKHTAQRLYDNNR